jgi:hypothetical protein
MLGTTIVGLSCTDASAPGGGISYPPVNEVIVYAGTVGELVEVGDTIRIDAEGFHDGNGFNVERSQSVTFAVSDPSVVSLESTAWKLPVVPTIRARGLRPGLVTITARINTIVGTDSLRVIPTVQSVAISPNPATVFVNDSVQLNVSSLRRAVR